MGLGRVGLTFHELGYALRGHAFTVTLSPNTQTYRWERPAQGGEGSGGSVVEVLVAKHRAPREAVESQFKDMYVRCVWLIECAGMLCVTSSPVWCRPIPLT